MSTTFKAGIYIGVLCGIWTFVMGFTGWYIDPVMMNAFYIVVLIQIGVLIWGLKKTSIEKTYGSQVLAGLLMSVIGGIILFFVSIIFTSVVFPNYFEELRAAHTGILRSEGKTDAEIVSTIEQFMAMQTTFWQALFGLIGTVVTGLVVSLIIAIFFRKKENTKVVQ